MRSAVFFLLVGMIHSWSIGQSCCASTNAAQFAELATNESFGKQHMEPIPYAGDPIAGEWVQFPLGNGSQAKAWLVASKDSSNRWLFVFHEWWGLNDHIRAEGARLAGLLDSTNVLCLDMYNGKTSSDRNGAAALMGALDKERSDAIISGAATYAGAKARVVTLGWCMGGALSLQASLSLGEQGVGCVIYYGMPELDAKKLAGLHAPVLGIFATEDEWINPDVVDRFTTAMQKAGKTFTVESYKADHAFANPSNPHHDAKATREANAKALAFIADSLGVTKTVVRK